ncbi:5'-nucleotidase C-terminal domain-containing protein [bacterium]|nr:5'-nucleotidase C-terminal domain-containing protein [bacterium]MBU1598539.1 5'-nucleotidase C-terminal domain-containing protein [bacterium]
MKIGIDNEFNHFIRILHFNDFHSCIEEDGKWKIAQLVKKIEERIEDFNGVAKRFVASRCFVLAAGDLISKESQFEGKVTIQGFRYSELELSVLGNHEFDFGSDYLRKLMDRSNFNPCGKLDYTCLNLDFDPLESNLKRVSTFPVGDLNIKILGLILQELSEHCPPTNLTGTKMLQPFEWPDELTKKDNNDFLIALNHLGIESDRKFIKEHPEIDVVIGGHSHDRKTSLFMRDNGNIQETDIDFEEGGRNYWEERDGVLPVNCTIYSQALKNGELLGEIDIYASATKKKLKPPQFYSIENVVYKNGPLKEYLEAQRNELLPEMMKEIHHSFKDGLDDENIRQEDKELGRVIADAMRWGVEKEIQEKIDFSFINSGCIRKPLPPESVRRGDIREIVFPGEELYTFQIKGEDIIELFKLMGEYLIQNKLHGGFLQVSGVEVKITINEKKGCVKKVELKILGKDVRGVWEGNVLKFQCKTNKSFLRQGV